MNFISQSLSQLTSGGQIYIVFQFIYILLGVYALYVLTKLLKVANKILPILERVEFKEDLAVLFKKQMKEWTLSEADKKGSPVVQELSGSDKGDHHV